MRNVIWVVAVALLFVPAFGGEPPQQGNGMDLTWAFPVPDKDFPPEDNSAVRKVPGSAKSYTQGQIDDLYNPPDWFPEEHAISHPDLVTLNPPISRACLPRTSCAK